MTQGATRSEPHSKAIFVHASGDAVVLNLLALAAGAHEPHHPPKRTPLSTESADQGRICDLLSLGSHTRSVRMDSRTTLTGYMAIAPMESRNRITFGTGIAPCTTR